MINDFFKNHWEQIAFNILILIIFILAYGHFGDVIIDSFREAYIPERMLDGKILYKNIFCIYAPLAYMINASLFYIFGTGLKVLYFAGLFATIGILNTIFKIARTFMSKIHGLGIILFIITASIMSPNVFNFIFPYSYGMLYGLFFILLSVYFCLKERFFIAYFMYSSAVCCKYEFLLLLPFLFWISGRKNLIKNTCALMLPFLITFIPLIIQGLNFNDLIAQVQIIMSIMSTKTIYWFYSISGLVFRPELILVYLINLVKIALPFALLYFCRHWIIVPLIAVYGYFVLNQEILIYSFPLILLISVFRYKSLSKKEKFIIFASMAVSMKIFFALTLMSYGIYFIPFALISIYILLPEQYKRAFFLLIILSSLAFGIKNAIILHSKNVKIETTKGVVYANSYYGKSIKKLTEYINENIEENEKVYVFPECLSVNFLTGRISDDKFYSLIPLYTETFGEDLIIGRIRKENPEYIVISNYDTSNYYYSYFGQDYARKIFDYVIQNYDMEFYVDDKFSFIVYKKK